MANMTVCNDYRTYVGGFASCALMKCAGVTRAILPGPNVYSSYSGYPEPNRSSIIVFNTTDMGAYDPGPIRMLDLIVQFMLDNAPDSLNPVMPAPEPFNFPGGIKMFQGSDYGGDFRVASRDFARQSIAMDTAITFADSFNNTVQLGIDVAASYATIRVNARTARCGNPELAAIGWLTTNVSLGDVQRISYFLKTINVTNAQTEPANWPAECLYWANDAVFYCDLFESYYSYASLRNTSILPNPWRDLNTIATAFNYEYVNCGAPTGCFGVMA